jgi:hypothetical protein
MRRPTAMIQLPTVLEFASVEHGYDLTSMLPDKLGFVSR